MQFAIILSLLGFAIAAIAAFNSKSKKDFSIKNFLKF